MKLISLAFEKIQRYVSLHFVLGAVMIATTAGAQRVPEYRFTSVDAPGSLYFTGILSFNNSGAIAGVRDGADGHVHGFVRIGSAYTTIDVPGMTDTGAYNITEIDFPGAAGTSGTQCNGINNLGEIVGPYSDVNDHIHGWILRNGRFTQIDFPGAPASECDGINDFGTLAGQYTDNYGITHGYIAQRR
ncbi:MAG: hypothetical protein JWL77_6179 [Chthonomonadaceae bacterium]|nr:hypothetical protein [Chthonomonadaceae bacterium]